MTPAPFECWLADDWARWAADHGVKVTDLRQVRLTSWAALAAASYDKRAKVYALGRGGES
jgi:glucose-6-phosphate dehydrogenase assembly protein OpcA